MDAHRRGVITIAFGARSYLDEAKMLARSLALHSPSLPRAIVTDADDAELRSLFQVVVPLRPEYGPGLLQKLSLDRYTPFASTLFLDADSLAVGDVEEFWKLFGDAPFAAVGQMQAFHPWSHRERIAERYRFAAYPVFNGGLYYFRGGPEARALFEEAREVAGRYEELGLKLLRNAINEEAAFAFAMAAQGVPVVDDGGCTMRTPVGIRGGLRMDVLRGFCSFEKFGRPVAPAVVHFTQGSRKTATYRRECLKLRVAHRPALRRVAVPALHAVFAPLQAVEDARFWIHHRIWDVIDAWRAWRGPVAAGGG